MTIRSPGLATASSGGSGIWSSTISCSWAYAHPASRASPSIIFWTASLVLLLPLINIASYIPGGPPSHKVITMPIRQIQKRSVVWSIAIMLLLASYVAGEPFLTGLALCRCRNAMPVVSAVYAPIGVYRSRDLLGADSLRSYSMWGLQKSLPWFAPEELGLQFMAAPAPSTEAPVAGLEQE